MDIQTRKITFVQEFLKLQNEDIISGLESMLRKKKAELFESGMKPMTPKQLNAEIDQAMDDSRQNRLTEATELRERI